MSNETEARRQIGRLRTLAGLDDFDVQLDTGRGAVVVLTPKAAREIADMLEEGRMP